MDFKLTAAEGTRVRAFGELCAEVFAPAAAEVDAEADIPHGHWDTLVEAGYLALTAGAPDAEGTLLLWTALGEELARTCASTMAATLPALVFGRTLTRHGTDAQRAAHLADLAGGAVVAVALTDAKGPPGDAPPETVVEQNAEGYVLTGYKPLVLGAPFVETALVLATSDAAADPPGQALLLVARGAEGFTPGRPVETMGVRGGDLGPLSFEGCTVPADQLVGEWNGAAAILEDLLALQRIGWAAYSVGVGQACVDAATAHAATRRIKGKRISRKESVHFKIAEMHLLVDTARQLTRKAAWLVDTGQRAGIVAAAAKVLAAEAATEAGHKAMQVLGGRGYLKGADVERLFRDARVGEIAGETTEVLRGIIARDALEEFAV